MSVKTNNAYGKISISNEAIARITACAALECYGIVEIVSSKNPIDISQIFKIEKTAKGVKVVTNGDRIYIDVFVIIKFGVSISAVANSLKDAIKYKVEKFTGMIVDTVNVNITGVKL